MRRRGVIWTKTLCIDCKKKVKKDLQIRDRDRIVCKMAEGYTRRQRSKSARKFPNLRTGFYDSARCAEFIGSVIIKINKQARSLCVKKHTAVPIMHKRSGMEIGDYYEKRQSDGKKNK